MTIALDRAPNQQQSDRSPLSQKDKIAIASVLCWDMCAIVEPHEVITIAIRHEMVQVVLTGGRLAIVPVETFKSILHQQRQQQPELEEADVAYVIQLEAKLQKQSAEIEVDRQGRIYRVWKGIRLLGTFYRVGKNWVAEPSNREPLPGFRTASAAQKAVTNLAAMKQEAA